MEPDMCGLLTVIDFKSVAQHASTATSSLDQLAHRGPDGRGIRTGPFFWSGHRRLAIVDPEGSPQPFSHDGMTWVANGEIYNHRALRLEIDDTPTSGDCAILGAAWRKYGVDFLAHLDGPFAFTLCDEQSGQWIAARDPYGICPLYVGDHEDGSVWVASEMKALVDVCTSVRIVDPGTYLLGDADGYRAVSWYRPSWRRSDDQPRAALAESELAELLDAAVEKRLMSDVPLGVLLSGGLDSSLVAALAARHLEKQGSSEPLHTFSIGLEGAPDLVFAQQVADHIGSRHHTFTFTIEEALDAVPKVIWHLESFEQVRTAVPTFLLAQKIHDLGFKVVLSGEGADEIFGGYLYFHRAPDAHAFHEECARKLDRLHLFDVMRANKAPMAHGLELRFPFLDRRLVEAVMAMNPTDKMIAPEATAAPRQDMEKSILRRSFEGLLPEGVLWRQKEQFSDGVGYGWVDALEAHARSMVDPSDQDIDSAAPEASWLRMLFRDHFVHGRRCGASAEATVPLGRSIACSTPEALSWDPAWERGLVSMSGRAMKDVHAG